MPQLHLYVRDEVAERLRERATQRGLSLSRYLAEIVEQEAGGDWPTGFFDELVGAWEGEVPEIEDPPPAEPKPF